MSDRDRTARELCDEIAALLDTDEGLRTARLLSLTGALRETDAEGLEAVTRREVSVRARPTAPKKDPNVRRVCLIGESVATGWHYAPDCTPAKWLAEWLEAAARADGHEVIDLSEIGLSSEGLLDVMAASSELEPDVFVILAGNNWGPSPPLHPVSPLSHFQSAALAIRSGGVAGLARLFESWTNRVAEGCIDEIARLARENGARVVLVVPEVNLLDWARDRPVPWLPGDGSARWYELLARCRTLLHDGCTHEAARVAEEAIALDGGVCATSHRLLGVAQYRTGHVEEACESLRRAVSARTWDNVPATPSVTPAVQSILRRKALEHGFVTVDLPEVFRREADGAPPGRELFLDYCHLTSRGIAVATTEIGRAILSLSSEPLGQACDAALAPIPAATEGRGRLLSGLLHLHHGTPAEAAQTDPEDSLARHWFESAMAIWPSAQDFCATYLTSRAAPSWVLSLSTGAQALTAHLGELFDYAPFYDNVDGGAVLLLGPLLGDRAPELLATVESALHDAVKNHGVGAEARDLTDSVYQWISGDWADRAGPFGAEREGFHRARWPSSRFCLVSDAKSDLELEVTARLAESGTARTARDLSVHVNGVRLGVIALDTTWTVARISIPTQTLASGFNRIALHWPALPADGDGAISRIVRRLETGLPVDLHPIFGELFSLRAFAPRPAR